MIESKKQFQVELGTRDGEMPARVYGDESTCRALAHTWLVTGPPDARRVAILYISWQTVEEILPV